jgi:3',5'-cyclic AMP phosphodiesterase CpdA
MGAEFTFAHLSDPHLTSPAGLPARAWLGKPALGYLSWRLRRRARHRAHVLAALLRDLESIGPDHAVVTGDLTTLGLPGELDEAWRWLRSVGPPARLTVVPGNHDAYTATAVPAMLARWAPYLGSDDGDASSQPGAPARFPSVRVRGPVAFLGICSAHPSAPLLATGKVGADQLRGLAQALTDTRARGLFRVVLVHHPVLPGTVRWRKRLTDAGALCDVLARDGAELVLHGHGHRSAFGYLEVRAGSEAGTGAGDSPPIPVIGVSSASAVSTEPEQAARYHLYQVTRQAGEWALTLRVRGYSPASGSFVAEGAPRSLR